MSHLLFAPFLVILLIVIALEINSKISRKQSLRINGLLSVIAGLLYLSNLGVIDQFEFNGFYATSILESQHYAIALTILVSGIFIIVSTFWSIKLSRVISGISLLLLSAIFLNHIHDDGSNHASWLKPYHQGLSIILLTIGVSLIVAAYRRERLYLWLVVAGYGIASVMLLLYKDPYAIAQIVTCENPGKIEMVYLSDKKIIPENIYVNKCDSIVFRVTGENGKLLSFGEHNHHSEYPGFYESFLTAKKDLHLLMVKTGKFKIHYHNNEIVNAIIKVN